MQLPVSVLAEAKTIGGVTPLIPKGGTGCLMQDLQTSGRNTDSLTSVPHLLKGIKEINWSRHWKLVSESAVSPGTPCQGLSPHLQQRENLQEGFCVSLLCAPEAKVNGPVIWVLFCLLIVL